MARLSTSLKQVMDLIGCECVYKERGLVLHAELIAVSIKGEMLGLKFKQLASPGFSKRSIRTFTFECVREYVSFHKNRICSSLIGAEIFFQKSEVKELVLFMETMPDGQSFIRKLREYRQVD
jgi:hypothetical protein